MKNLKKINLGLVLAIIAIVGVIVYCICVENGRKSSKDDINKACESFINVTNKYAVLPEEYQVVGIKKSDVNLEGYYVNMQSDIKGQTKNNETANIQKMILEEVTAKQLLNTNSVITSFDRQIDKIVSYQFSGNQATVTFNSKIIVKQKYKDLNGEEKIKEDYAEIQGETITLEKINGSWKVVYANLKYANPAYSVDVNNM